MSSIYRLMAPGPVQLAPEVLESLAAPMIHHRTPQFQQILERVLRALPPLFRTKNPVMMLTSTGTGGMEAALINTLSPGDEVVCIDSGKFGERWATMARTFGIKVHVLTVPWGEAVELKDLKSILEKHPHTRAVLTQACETSTATLHDVHGIARVVRSTVPEALLMVDAITAIGATPLDMDAWDLDVVVAGSQKAFMIPTGLAFVALSDRAWAAQKKCQMPRFYFDLAKELKSNQKGETLFSSSVSLVSALDRVLPRFAGSNLEAQIARCTLHAEVTRNLAKNILGLACYSKAPAPAVTALVVPESVDGQKLRKHIEAQYNITVMGGQDQLKGRILRLGHLGYVTNEDLIETLVAIAKSLRDLGHPLPESINKDIRSAASSELKKQKS